MNGNNQDVSNPGSTNLSQSRYWLIAYGVLLIGWVSGALLFMARVPGGFLTNYLSDLTFPAWFYIYLRGLSTRDGRLPSIPIFRDWFGLTPERALLSILGTGILSELKTLYWPTGILTGTFDYVDIAAYAVGLLICYYFDKRTLRETATSQSGSVNSSPEP